MNRLSCNAHPSLKKVGNVLSLGAPPVRIQGIQSSNILKKPSRPLTAFHIFSQLEKEFIMQRPDGDCEELVDLTDDAQTNNSYLPRRYQGLDIPRDWCESPGKRRKRKHRKTSSSSRSVDFVSMSRMIAARWAELAEVDMETKLFCQDVAEQKLMEYLEDLKKYKAALEDRVSSSSSDEEETVGKQDLQAQALSLKKAHSDGKYLLGRARSDEHNYSSPYPTQGYKSNHCKDLDSLFKKNDLEIEQCVKYFNRMSSQSSRVNRSLQRSSRATTSPPRPSHLSLVSPSNSFTESDIPTFGTGRYGLVDMDDDEIIALFTGKKASKQGSSHRVETVAPHEERSYQSSVDKKCAADFLSVCHPCNK